MKPKPKSIVKRNEQLLKRCGFYQDHNLGELWILYQGPAVDAQQEHFKDTEDVTRWVYEKGINTASFRIIEYIKASTK